MLAEMVKAGTIPAVDARLPKQPCVMKSAVGAMGNYGGNWRRAFNGVSDRWGPTKLIDRNWAWFDLDLNLQPRLLESWQLSPDAKEWTLKLREGLKWSDGSEFTSDDFAWWYEHELPNKKLNPSVPVVWRSPDNTMVQFAAPDKYTVKFTYTQPKPMLVYSNTRGGTGGPITPSKYMATKHEDTTPDKTALEADVKARGFASWERYYLDFANQWYANPEKPSLGPWLSKGELSSEIFPMERNPYFWAVDTEGNQLPYIDKVTHRLFESPEVLNLWITNGEIDMQRRHMNIANLALYKSGEAKGDYKTVMSINAGHVAMQLNLSTKNEKLNEVFNDLKVRQAISSAINRDQVNELVYNGMLKPRQYSPLSMSPQYYEKASTAWITYDPDLANQLLDEAGYTQKDAQGLRLFKDGSGPISFIVEGTDQTGTPTEDAALLVSQDLAKVGIKATYKYSERALYTEHYEANEIEAAWWGGDRTVLPLVPEAIIFRGIQPDRPWCPGWGFYYNNPDGPNAVKPPDGHWIYDIWDIWDKEVAVEPDPEKQTAAFKKILDIWAEQLPMIGILGEQPSPCIVKNGFMGYPEGLPDDDTTGDEQFAQSETYFWDDPSKHMG
jgi:peptide/nickel transport system substrate-binding protein